MNILEAILANTPVNHIAADDRLPVVLSEQHDVNNIDVGSGGGSANKLPSDRLKSQIQSISNGGWDAAEYGRSREAQVAILTESLNKALEFEKTPEGIESARVEAEKTLLELRDRAIQRAGLDTSNGKVSVFVAGQAPWHKLGVNVKEAVNSTDAARLASIDWEVSKLPLQYTDATGTIRTQEKVFGIVRNDTGAFLGSVGSRYQPIQNAQSFDFLDSVLDQFGAKYEAAGAVFGGEKVFLLVHLPKQRFAVNGQDVTEAYALFSNPHNGEGVATCIPTSVRVCCSNTLRVATNAGRGKGIGIRHTGNIKNKIAEAQQALGLAVKGFDRYAEQAQVLAATPLPNVKGYFNDVLDEVLEVTAAEAQKGFNPLGAALLNTALREKKEKEFEKAVEKREDILKDLIERYDGEKCGIGGIRGTAWSALQAVTESADFIKPKRQVGSEESRLSRRFESVITGDADDLKQKGLEKVLEYATRS